MFYVGASRAKVFLDIVAMLNGEQLQALGDSLFGGQTVKNAITKIASVLKVKIVRD